MNPNPTARVALPADHKWAHLVKGVVATVADPAAFDIDRFNDLDMAVGEASAAMFDIAGGRRLEVDADSREGGVRVEMRLDLEPGEEDPATPPLLAYVLDALASDVVRGPGSVAFTILPV